MIKSTGAALKTIADWATDGDEFVRVSLYDRPPAYVRDWAPGDVLATQGDAHIHVDANGSVREVVPHDVLVGRRIRR